MKNYHLLKTSKTFFYITSSVIVLWGTGYIALNGYNLYAILILVVGLGILSFAILYKNYMIFNDDEILMIKGFLKTTLTKSLKYYSVKGLYIIFQIRGESLFLFKIDENKFKRTVSFSIDYNFNSSLEIKEYLNFLYRKGINIYCKNEEYLLKTFNKELKDIKKEKDRYNDIWYYIEGENIHKITG